MSGLSSRKYTARLVAVGDNDRNRMAAAITSRRARNISIGPPSADTSITIKAGTKNSRLHRVVKI